VLVLLDEVVYPHLVLACITRVSIFYCLAEGQMNGVRGLSVEPAGRDRCSNAPSDPCKAKRAEREST
jgi:hypothetical protein